MPTFAWILIALAAFTIGFVAGRRSGRKSSGLPNTAYGNAGHDAVLKPAPADEAARMRGGSL